MADRTYELAELEEEKTFLLRLFRLHDVGREWCVPAIVEEYSRDTHTAKVKPLVNRWKMESGKVKEHERASVRVGVMQFAHGGVVVDAPLFKGDTGWLVAGDRNSASARGANSAFLYKDQRDDARGEERRNRGAKSPDNADGGGFCHGFFIPCSWAAGKGVGDGTGLVVRYAKGMGQDSKGNDAEVGVRDVRVSAGGVAASVKAVDGADAGLSAALEETGGFVRRVGDDGGADEVRLTADGLKFSGVVDREMQVVTDVRYDVASHCVQKRTATLKVRGDFVVGVSEETGWQTIEGGQAVPEKDD